MKRACLILALLALWGFALAQNQPLAITSPNGGESWALGSTHAVTWTSVNLSGGVTLALIGVNSTTPQLTIATNIPVQQGVFQWTIPAAIIPGSYYKVKVFMPSPAGTMLQDLSDAPFSITPNDDPPPPQTFITVLSPMEASSGYPAPPKPSPGATAIWRAKCASPWCRGQTRPR